MKILLKITESWSRYGFHPSLFELTCAAALSTHGALTQAHRHNIAELKTMNLRDVDISTIPAEELANLTQCVRESVEINNVHGDLSPVLSNVKCDVLRISKATLSTAETQSLVSAMVSGVEKVELGRGVTLDMETLARYDGTGECRLVWLWGQSTSSRCGEQVSMWTEEMGWKIRSKNGRKEETLNEYLTVLER